MTLQNALPNDLTLLVADDDADLLEEASHWLTAAGYRVQLARDGRDAIAALDGGLRPSVIVLDLLMPHVSGWDVWDWLQQSSCRDIPVIIWTATGLRDGSVSNARVVGKRDPADLLKAIQDAAPGAMAVPLPMSALAMPSLTTKKPATGFDTH